MRGRGSSGRRGTELGTVARASDVATKHPVRAFLRQRLGFSLGDFSEAVEDALPVELDALEAWDIGERLLEARLAGVDLKTAVQAEIARGTLPPGRLAVP